MSRQPLTCVVDASAGIKLFLPEDYAEVVHQIFEQCRSDSKACLFVPDLYFVECANILWKKVKWGEYPRNLAELNISDLKYMNLTVIPCAELIERALEIACDYGVTTYDACYVALAERYEVSLLTADERLAAIIKESLCSVVVLGDLN